MPCEGCNIQFTVFRRKRICSECRRFYCNNCLTKQNSSILCERCLIFSKRPLSKVDLLKLKPKDLIFYLQSKHISTTGCVEKEELVNLILTHVDSADANGSQRCESGDNNPFDNLKQSCQNFFTNFTEKISSELNFETKSNSATTPSSVDGESVTDQPRVLTRELPQYYSNSNSNAEPQPNSNHSGGASTSASTPSSPLASLNSVSSHSVSSASSKRQERPQANTKRIFENVIQENGNTSGCECSDDEIIVMYKHGQAQKSPSPVSPSNEQNAAGPSGAHVENEESPTSSFEELGAIGGIESTQGSGNTISDNENWQIVTDDTKPEPMETETSTQETDSTVLSLLPAATSRHPFLAHPTPPTRPFRRRSDGYFYRRQVSDGALLRPFSPEYPSLTEDPEQAHLHSERTSCCSKCGKTKSNIKRHISRFRKHLESSQMTEAEIKSEIESFLQFLETRAKSIDYSDSCDPLAASDRADSRGAGSAISPIDGEGLVEFPEDLYDDNEGIHVYAHDEESCINNSRFDHRFVNLGDFQSREEFEELSVKQLKEILMLNRVDYKGCCEKNELLERVLRLWNNSKTCPAVEKLPSQELCKICMDAPIECVFLECGHMATCTSCGKVLSECPICRQYIVRLVRIFRV